MHQMNELKKQQKLLNQHVKKQEEESSSDSNDEYFNNEEEEEQWLDDTDRMPINEQQPITINSKKIKAPNSSAARSSSSGAGSIKGGASL